MRVPSFEASGAFRNFPECSGGRAPCSCPFLCRPLPLRNKQPAIPRNINLPRTPAPDKADQKQLRSLNTDDSVNIGQATK